MTEAESSSVSFFAIIFKNLLYKRTNTLYDNLSLFSFQWQFASDSLFAFI